MALFTDIMFNPKSGKHEMYFVNQQYDFLMDISYNETTKKYEFNCDHERAKEIANGSWGRDDFDPVKELKKAEKELKAADANPVKKKNVPWT